ncbi:JPH2 protein, partial [Centropus bengalensis]|nr:JPH2 protein [Centropus bengalensis]
AGSRAGGGSPAPAEGESRPASRALGRPAEQMEIGPLQRMAHEPDVEHVKGYHSYAVRTSPVLAAVDYEEELLPEPEPPSPEPRELSQPRGSTPAPAQEREEKPVAKVEGKAEVAKEVKQRLSPERRAVGRAESAANKKTEARAPGRMEPKAGAKRTQGPAAAVPVAREAEECEEGPNTIVICMVILLNIGLAILFVHFLT